MKKILAFTVSICLIMSVMTACGNVAESKPVESVSVTEATTTPLQTTTTTTTTTIATTTTTTTTTTTNTTSEPKAASLWNVSYAKDEWGEEDKTEPLISTVIIDGKFSNSAATNAELNVGFSFYNDVAAFLLSEYGTHTVKGKEEKYKITIIDESGNTIEREGLLYDYMLIIGGYSGYSESREELKNLLLNNKILKVKIWLSL